MDGFLLTQNPHAAASHRYLRLRHPLPERIYWGLRGFPAQRVLDLLSESQWWSREAMAEFRLRKLKKLLLHAQQTVPYYRELFSRHAVQPESFTCVRDLRQIPPLTKEIIRARWSELQSDAIPDSCTYLRSTGGTTGEPLRVRVSRQDSVWQSQCYARGLSWGGLSPGDRRGLLFGGSLGKPLRSPFIRRVVASRREVSSPAFELNSERAIEFARVMRRTGCRYLLGYASALYLLACHLGDQSETLDLNAVFPTAEMLFPEWGNKIMNVFHCSVLPYFGCGEVNSIAFMCAEECAYHVSEEHCVVESESPGGDEKEQYLGNLLVTDLDNFAMPIIRYRNGDSVKLGSSGCACGRVLGTIIEIGGRINDLLLRGDGERVSGVLGTHTFLAGSSGVDFWQVVQETVGEVSVRLVVNQAFDRGKEESRISDTFRRHLGENTRVRFEYVSEIERTVGGKRPLVVGLSRTG